jgi:hypothetical protein
MTQLTLACGDHPVEPSPADCQNQATGRWGERETKACWFTQMGGYCAKCVMVYDRSGTDNGHLEIFVWHNGDFPFITGDDDEEKPRKIHICDPTDWKHFSEKMMAFVDAKTVEEDEP